MIGGTIRGVLIDGGGTLAGSSRKDQKTGHARYEDDGGQDHVADENANWQHESCKTPSLYESRSMSTAQHVKLTESDACVRDASSLQANVQCTPPLPPLARHIEEALLGVRLFCRPPPLHSESCCALLVEWRKTRFPEVDKPARLSQRSMGSCLVCLADALPKTGTTPYNFQVPARRHSLETPPLLSRDDLYTSHASQRSGNRQLHHAVDAHDTKRCHGLVQYRNKVSLPTCRDRPCRPIFSMDSISVAFRPHMPPPLHSSDRTPIPLWHHQSPFHGSFFHGRCIRVAAAWLQPRGVPRGEGGRFGVIAATPAMFLGHRICRTVAVEQDAPNSIVPHWM